MVRLKTYEALKIPESKEFIGTSNGKYSREDISNGLSSPVMVGRQHSSRVFKWSRNCTPGFGLCQRSICKTMISLNLFVILCLSIYNRSVTNYNYRRVLDMTLTGQTTTNLNTDRHEIETRPSNQEIWELSQRINMDRCEFPKLNPFAEEIRPFLKRPSLINCVHGANTGGNVRFSVDRGTRTLRRHVDTEGDGDCCYRPFYRETDDELQTGECYPIKSDVTEISLEVDYIEVFCVNGRDDYRDGFALVSPKPEVEFWTEQIESSQEIPKDNRLNVIIFGIDATSHMNFLRTMPKSRKYLEQNLSAIVLNGYTKVAENTLPNVVPLLTGLTLEEFKDRCVEKKAKNNKEIHLDKCPFVWKSFEANGYRTSFAEDDVDISIFNMNWPHAFIKPPTHYYLRPFSQRMQYKQSSQEGYCYGTRLSFKALLDNIEHMAEAFNSTQPYFQFTWATKLSHNNFNKLSLGDKSLRNMLKYLSENGHLNNTALIVMSDHGSRLDDIRGTSQGQLEDRMPLFYIVLPKWLRDAYPEAVDNFENNSNRLTSSFDVYETFKDLMDLRRLHKGEKAKNQNKSSHPLGGRQPTSLFEEIPQNRTCFMAGVPMHWCVCHAKRPIEITSGEVQDAVSYVIGYMNHILKSYWSCATLKLEKITDAFTLTDKYMSEKATSADSNAMDMSLLLLQVSFLTEPGGGTFEATVIRDSLTEKWTLTEQPVRTNSYGTQSHCVEQELKEFCFCRN